MEKPKSKIALIRSNWPDIVTALRAGHTLKCVCERLNEAGVAVEYKTLRAYVSVLHREQARGAAPVLETKPRPVRVSEPVPAAPRSVPPISRPNPLATAMEYLSKVRGFQNFTSEPPDPGKLF